MFEGELPVVDLEQAPAAGLDGQTDPADEVEVLPLSLEDTEDHVHEADVVEFNLVFYRSHVLTEPLDAGALAG